MKIQTLLLTVLLGLASTAAFADTPAPAAGADSDRHGMCAANPDECTQLAAKFDQWCQANAQKCTDLKARIEKHREKCARDHEKCKEMMRHHDEDDQDHGDDKDDDGGNGGNP